MGSQLTYNLVMQNIVRKITAAAITVALLPPTSTGIATAQYSFGSSSFNLGSSAIEDPITVEFERGYEAYISALGHTLDQEYEAQAEALLQRGLNGELSFVDRQYLVHDVPNATYYWVDQMYLWEVESFLNNLDETLWWAENNQDGWNARFGVAVAQKGEYYYIAGVENYGG